MSTEDKIETQTPFSHRNLLNLIKTQLVVGSIVELRGARGFVSGNLLSCLKSSLVFKVDCNPGGPKRVARDRGGHAGINLKMYQPGSAS